MNTLSWYVLRSKPHQERLVECLLRENSVEYYYPTIKVKPVNPRAKKVRPYFPGYMFVYVETENMMPLQWLPGTLGFARFDGYIPAIPDSFVAEIRDRVSAIQQVGGLNLDGLQKGSPVRITSGPLEGYEAIFDVRLGGGERVRILLEILGRLVKAEVDASAIEKKRTG